MINGRENPMGERRREAFRVRFDRSVKIEFAAQSAPGCLGIGLPGGCEGLHVHSKARPEAVRAFFLGRGADTHCLAYKRTVRRWPWAEILLPLRTVVCRRPEEPVGLVVRGDVKNT